MPEKVTQIGFDREVEAELVAFNGAFTATLTRDMIPAFRASFPSSESVKKVLDAASVDREDFTVAGYQGDEIVVSVLKRRGRVGIGPGIYHTHGGGMIAGDRFTGIEHFLPWITELDAVVVAVEYRLAPEFPDPYPVEDCYAGLLWMGENLERLGVDPARLIVEGASAGGGIAAGIALTARDRRGPSLAGQVLIYPMLDDRDATISSAQIDGVGTWDRSSNIMGWTELLGDRRATADVSIYAAPSRATDLSGLPPAYIECGSAEVFRDEDVAYASALWRDGVQAELHVWPGGFHAFDLAAPRADISTGMVAARNAWVARMLRL